MKIKEKFIILINYPINKFLFCIYFYTIFVVILFSYDQSMALDVISSMNILVGLMFVLISTMWMILPNIVKKGMGRNNEWVIPSFELLSLGIILQIFGYVYSISKIPEGIVGGIIVGNIIAPTIFIIYIHYRIKELMVKK